MQHNEKRCGEAAPFLHGSAEQQRGRWTRPRRRRLRAVRRDAAEGSAPPPERGTTNKTKPCRTTQGGAPVGRGRCGASRGTRRGDEGGQMSSAKYARCAPKPTAVREPAARSPEATAQGRARRSASAVGATREREREEPLFHAPRRARSSVCESKPILD